MNKTALKNFATNARRELIKKVEAKALKIGITEENIKKAQIESSDAIYIDGKQLSITEKKQRDKLIQRIKDIGFKQVVEEVAYTWFNRFIALRFMEVNNYLPTKVRVLSSSNPDSPEPDILKEALSVDLDIDKELVYELKLNNKTEELYKYLIIKQCNSLNKYLPFLFETIEDYKEILFPEGLLAKDSFLREMTDTDKIPESDWEQVEIIGWLYQFYISEKKDQVFADLKKNIKISKENIPAATQLFTPHWIVRYMVENSLGRIWLESYPNSSLKSEWKYYLDEAEQEEEVKKKLEEIRYKNVNPEDITFLDPCCGSGHILVYAFDVLYEMYLEIGYINHEIPKMILEKNLFGLDIDDRAVQLASFALMMKAREKSRRVFGQDIKLNICAIQESNWMTDDIISMFSKNENLYKDMLIQIRDTFWDAKEYGSLLRVEPMQFELLRENICKVKEEHTDLIDLIDKQVVEEKLPGLLLQARILSKKYDVVCTNPPYMGYGNMNDNLKAYVQLNHDKSKSDLCAAFIEVGMSQTKKNGYCSLVTMHSWFFLSSFEALRKEILDNFSITSILHLGMEAFDGIIGKVVQTAAFVLRNYSNSNYKPVGIRLVDFYDGRKYEKESQFFNKNNTYQNVKLSDFEKIPGTPIAYWANSEHYKAYEKAQLLSEISEIRKGLATGNTDRFIKYWFEVPYNKINFSKYQTGDFKWYPCHKGGDYRKWYGNLEKVINWENDGYEIKNYKDSNGKLKSRPQNLDYMLRKGITFSKITSAGSSCRLMTGNEFFDDAVQGIFPKYNTISVEYLLAVLNSPIIAEFLKILNPTLNKQIYDLERIPIIVSDKYDQINELSKKIIEISRMEWDERETSWNFASNQLVRRSEKSIKDRIKELNKYFLQRANAILELEEKINQILIEEYGIIIEREMEISEEVKNEDNISMYNDKDLIVDLISYGIGCIFGRYSLDEDGLVYAGGKFDPGRYQKYPVDKDNILPILSEAYFEDDIVSRFVEFVKVTFGEETLEENLEFIADTLGKRNGETARETIRRYFLNDFFKDHVKTYKKRPIYWLFTSGNQKAFNCLIYMHRYDKTTLSRIRTDYLHPLQMRLDAERKSLLEVIEGGGTAKEISNAKKELKQLDLKIEELKVYDELLHHMADMQIEIDLDDGVAVNYAKFNGLLAKLE